MLELTIQDKEIPKNLDWQVAQYKTLDINGKTFLNIQIYQIGKNDYYCVWWDSHVDQKIGFTEIRKGLSIIEGDYNLPDYNVIYEDPTGKNPNKFFNQGVQLFNRGKHEPLEFDIDVFRLHVWKEFNGFFQPYPIKPEKGHGEHDQERHDQDRCSVMDSADQQPLIGLQYRASYGDGCFACLGDLLCACLEFR